MKDALLFFQRVSASDTSDSNKLALKQFLSDAIDNAYEEYSEDVKFDLFLIAINKAFDDLDCTLLHTSNLDIEYRCNEEIADDHNDAMSC